MGKSWMYVGLLTLAAAAIVCGSRSFAQIDHSIDETNQTAGQDRDAQDRRFAKDLLEKGMAQIQLAQLAMQKTSDSQVKDYAQQVVKDRTAIDGAVENVAKRLGVSVPSKLSHGDRKSLEKLSGLSGSDFDQAFLKQMIRNHKDEVGSCHDEVSNGQDPGLRNLANQAADTFNSHLQMAEKLAQKS
jgi:putative membrane protein